MSNNFSNANNLRFLLFGLVILLSACQNRQTIQPQAQVEDLNLTYQTNQNNQINAAVHLIETGDIGTAKKLIQQVLKHNPKHSVANLLMTQLNLPMSKIFPTKRFTSYRVKSGDSLGAIAQQWLGNSLYFVSLAKLNKINKPVQLQPGTLLKIPVIANSKLVKKELSRSAANIRLIQEYREKKEYFQGLEKANQLFVLAKDISQLFHQQQLILDALTQVTASLSERETMLKRVAFIATDSRSAEQKALYQRFINAQNRQLFLDEAVLLFEDKSYVQTAEKLIKAKAIDPKIDKETAVFRMQKILLTKLHEEAVVLYRQQSLQQALERWQLISKLEPENQLAQKYTQRTLKLIKKLNQF